MPHLVPSSTTQQKPYATLHTPSKCLIKVPLSQLAKIRLPNQQSVASPMMVSHDDDLVRHVFEHVLRENGECNNELAIEKHFLVDMLHLQSEWELPAEVREHCISRLCELISDTNMEYLHEVAINAKCDTLEAKCREMRQKRDNGKVVKVVSPLNISITGVAKAKHVRINDGPTIRRNTMTSPKSAYRSTASHSHAALSSPKSTNTTSSDILERMPFGDETPASATSTRMDAMTPYTHIARNHWASLPKFSHDDNGIVSITNTHSTPSDESHDSDNLELDADDLDVNLEQQNDEIVALESIYGMEQVHLMPHGATMPKFERLGENICVLNVQVDEAHVLSCEFVLPQDYPSHSAPVLTMKANWIDKKILRELTRIRDDMEDMFSRGAVVLFEWSEHLLAAETFARVQHLLDKSGSKKAKDNDSSPATSPTSSYMALLKREFPHLYKSASPTVCKSSKFVAHVATGIHSMKQIQRFIELLKTNNKIAIATHNIVAYRFTEPDGTLHENRDDDGEGGAGDVMLKLMQQMDVRDTVCVVTRWYGGTPLGSKRFKLISACAHEVLTTALKNGHGNESDR